MLNFFMKLLLHYDHINYEEFFKKITIETSYLRILKFLFLTLPIFVEKVSSAKIIVLVLSNYQDYAWATM